MGRFLKKRDASMGHPPGHLVFIGDKKTDEMEMRLIHYDATQLIETDLEEIDVRPELDKGDGVTWININGLHDTVGLAKVGEVFGLHPLLLEDVLNTGQRPKLEEFDDVLFLVLKMLRVEDGEVHAEQLSLVVGEGLLLTFQERPGDVFEPVRNRIRKSQGRVRDSGVDYLAYALVDTVVDSYIHIIEKLGNEVEDVEVAVLTETDQSILVKINELKREMSFMRKTVRPAREAIMRLSKLDTDLVDDETAPFLKDLHDITTQAVEAIDTYREMLSDALNIYTSMMSHRMNDIMKVLTIFAAIFIPLTFIAGIYGTNFENLPELHYEYSYYVFWGVMISVAVTMLVFFKRKGWL